VFGLGFEREAREKFPYSVKGRATPGRAAGPAARRSRRGRRPVLAALRAAGAGPFGPDASENDEEPSRSDGKGSQAERAGQPLRAAGAAQTSGQRHHL
jgi:hypothetical protein